MGDFKKLHVWGKAHALALNANRAAGRIRGPMYASLRSQIVRAAMSIPANIVEGRAQKSEREFSRFLGYALGSSAELEYHLIVARDTRALAEKDCLSLLSQLIEVRMMLHGLLSRISMSQSSSTRQ